MALVPAHHEPFPAHWLNTLIVNNAQNAVVQQRHLGYLDGVEEEDQLRIAQRLVTLVG